MSLNPEDSRRRGRSRSPGGRGGEGERERSRVRVPSPPSRYDDDDRDYVRDRYEYEERTTVKPARSDRDRDRDRDKYYERVEEKPRYASEFRDYNRAPSPAPARKPSYAMPGEFKEAEEESRVRYSDRREKDSYGKKEYAEKDYYREKDYHEEKKYTRESNYSPPTKATPKYAEATPRGREYSPPAPSKPKYVEADPRDRDPRRYEEDRYSRAYDDDRGGRSRKESVSISTGVKITHGRKESPSPPKARSPSPKRSYSHDDKHPSVITAGHSKYAEPKKWEYAPPEEKITYSRTESFTKKASEPSARSSQTQVVTVEPGRRKTSNADMLGARLGSLSVAAAAGAGTSLALAPGSPLLESYHGTYQSISPMPSPLMIAAGPHSSNTDVAVIDIGPLDASKRRHARFSDISSDANTLARALKGSKAPDTEPLIEILPALTHEQIMDLRVEYKKVVKTGKDAKGVNIAKHIKMRLKEEDPSLMKACYTTALGKWESEAYWANFWYQGEKSRRELLIESLMGRTNSEIRAIKDGFSDKKYSDSLTKCMKQELKEDKFKKAVLMVLEEKRMDERYGYPLDRRLVEEDVRELHKAVRSEKGGESAMIGIIVVRSDSHLREVLRVYESTYQTNFAREMLKKSGNLVGEMLAHILNGVINRPVRDALLLHHALTLTKSDSLRTELLVSRLVRFHWDRPHMEAIKREYRARYGKDLQTAVAEGSKGEWGEFCQELCVKRMGDEVRRVEAVHMSTGYRVS